MGISPIASWQSIFRIAYGLLDFLDTFQLIAGSNISIAKSIFQAIAFYFLLEYPPIITCSVLSFASLTDFLKMKHFFFPHTNLLNLL